MTRLLGLSPMRIKRVTELGQKMLDEAGEDACRRGYFTTDPFWVGHYALEYGDITEDGTLN
jgi:hypothetical protein